jgi:SMC interacting uncharacterized protein involved in chromosome segregation
MRDAINSKDARRLCTDVYAFQGSTTTNQCLDALRPTLAKAQRTVTIEVRSIEITGRRATVTAATSGLSQRPTDESQTFSLVREHGVWRVLFG